jgi:hypothetical protein
VDKDSAKEFEPAMQETEGGECILRLYSTGGRPRSQRAIENVQRICGKKGQTEKLLLGLGLRKR